LRVSPEEEIREKDRKDRPRGEMIVLEGISPVSNAAACDSGDNGQKNGEEI